MAAGLPTPGRSEAHRIHLAVAEDTKRAGGKGGHGAGGRGGNEGYSHARHDQPIKTTEDSSVSRQGQEGTPLTKPARISVLTLQSGENTCDVLRNVDLPSLGGSLWCKCWHHGGRCFSGCDRKGNHIPPTAVALATVITALKIEHAPG